MHEKCSPTCQINGNISKIFQSCSSSFTHDDYDDDDDDGDDDDQLFLWYGRPTKGI